MPIRPDLSAFLAKRAEAEIPPVGSIPIKDLRKLLLPSPEINGEAESIYSIDNRLIVGPTSYLPIRMYRPSPNLNLPLMVFFHGGGWVMGSLDAYDQSLSSMANLTGSLVIAVAYQKAPEHPFPTPFDDCYATLEWAIEKSSEIGIDRKRIGVAGDSAGGNLAAAVALKARDSKLIKLAYQLLIYPATTHTDDFESAERNATDFGLTRNAMRWFNKQYVQNEVDMNNPYAWPALANDHSNLPPAVLATAYYDVLQGDGSAYATILKNSGVEVNHIDYPDLIHGVFTLAGYSDAAKSMQNDLALAIRKYI